MALVKETGTATGQIDLLQKINDFIANDVANWSVQNFGSVGAISGFPNDRQLSIVRNSGTALYVHLISQIDDARPRLYFAGSSAYSGNSTAWNSHASGYGPRYGGLSLPPSTAGGDPFNYWFYATDDYFTGIIEIEGGWFQPFYFGGLLNPDGTTAATTAVITGTIMYERRTHSQADYNSTSQKGSNFLEDCVCPLGAMGINSLNLESGQAGCAYRRPNGSWNQLGSWDEPLSVTSAYRSYDRRWDDGFDEYPKSAIIKPCWQVRNNSQNMLIPLHTVEVTQTGPTSGKYNHQGTMLGVRACATDGIAEAGIVSSEGIDWRVFPAMRTRRIFHRHQWMGIAFQETE